MTRSLEIAATSDEDLDRLISLSFDGSKDAADLLWRSIEDFEALEEANKVLIDKARYRQTAAASEAARFKERILAQLQARDLKAVPTSYGKFARNANGGHQPMRIIGDYPDEFARIKREADLDKVRQALKEGEVLDFVEILDRGEHLRLRA